LTIRARRGSIQAGEVSMRFDGRSIRPAFLSLLAATLAVPLGSLSVFAQQDGPQKAPQKQEQKQEPKQEQKKPEYTISVEAPVVNVDLVVTDQDGNILTGLKKENFRVLEGDQVQTITNFAPTDAPITIVMLMEFSGLFGQYWSRLGPSWAYYFLDNLNQKDWVALKTFDLKTHIDVDFTQNKQEVQQAIASMIFPNFHEAVMNDALVETLDQLQDVKGKKSILLISTGLDTFSKHTLDQTYKRMRQTDVTIFCVSVSEYLTTRYNVDDIKYVQAKNEMNTFAKLTGGYAWFPRFDGEIPNIFHSVAAFLRNQYSLGYTPTNPAHDGKFRKIKVEVVGVDGNPLVVTNKKGKKTKIVVYAREGYTAPSGPIGD
jgi:VWFA-related protein